MPARVLIVEDDPAIAELVAFHLGRAGFVTEMAGSAAAARARWARALPDAVVLDLMLPDGTGLELCRELQRLPAGQGPAVVMLTALAEEGDRVAGLELGADDYVTKPFSPRELVARVRAVLRRREPQRGEEEGPLHWGRLVLDRRRVEASWAGQPLPLTATEFRLLWVLTEAQGGVCSRHALLDAVWGQDYVGEPRTVDVHIRHIREKLASVGAPVLLETIRGFGYRLSEDVHA